MRKGAERQWRQSARPSPHTAFRALFRTFSERSAACMRLKRREALNGERSHPKMGTKMPALNGNMVTDSAQ